MKKKFKISFICLFFTIMTIFGSYKVLSTINEYKIEKETYNSLEKYMNIETIKNNEPPTSTDNISFPTIDFTSLKQINQDIVGWINIDNLNINYPIVQGNDNDYYLRHMVDHTYNSAGSIFLDYRNNENFNNKHTIIYGHNMQNDSMFSNLTKYQNQKYYESNPYYLLMTPNKNYKIEIISSYTTNVNDNSWNITFTNNLEFENWLNDTIDKSLIKTNTIPTPENNIITLSTCSYEFNNARFVLVGILIEK